MLLSPIISSGYQVATPRVAASHAAASSRVAMVADATPVFGLARGQIYGPTAPAHPAEKPWTNLESQEAVQIVKATSQELREPLRTDMQNDEIFVSKDSSEHRPRRPSPDPRASPTFSTGSHVAASAV